MTALDAIVVAVTLIVIGGLFLLRLKRAINRAIDDGFDNLGDGDCVLSVRFHEGEITRGE